MLKENQKIWRYLKLWKFKSMLKERSLFFAKASVMEDIEEGRMPDESRLAIEFIAKDFPAPVGDEVLKQDQYQREIQENMRERVFINCWRMDDYESSKFKRGG